MDIFYGKGNYSIAEAVKVSDDNSDYDVKEVSSNRTARGYLIDIDRGQDGNYENTVFVDHSVENTDNITYFNIKEGIEKDFDLTLDPNYPEKIDFNPTEPPLETFGHPFIGYEKTEVKRPLNDGSGDCMVYVFKQLYICWIKVGDPVPVGAHKGDC